MVRQKRSPWKKLSKGTLLASLFLGLLSGCDYESQPRTTSAYLHNVDQILPLSPATNKTRFTLDGTEINSELLTTKVGTQVVLSLMAHEKQLEREVYDIQDGELQLVEAAGEHYDKPIPLLKFPLNLGDTWTWEGTLLGPTGTLPAKANVVTSEGHLDRKGRSDRAIMIEVQLVMKESGGKAFSRTLRFWMVQGQGIAKREFGNSIRESGE